MHPLLKMACCGFIKMMPMALLVSCSTLQSSEKICSFGVYSNGQEQIVLSDGTRGNGPPQTAYTFIDGRRGKLDTQSAQVKCLSGEIYDGAGQRFLRSSLIEQDVFFESSGTQLFGRLITPQISSDQTKPLAIFVHGSERTPTVGHSRYPWILAAQGVSVFVYDKRGTGNSGGTYTQDFQILGDDAAAAFRTAKKIADGKFDRVGFFGGSQGGWVAPLAATKVQAEFLVIGFGLILSPAEEDAEQVFEEMRRIGFESSDIAKAKQITDATGEVVASHFKQGVDELLRLRNHYKGEAWLSKIEGEYTGPLIRASEQNLREGHAPGFEDDNVDWRYDAAAVIRSLSIAQLWVIAENDRAAPGQLTYDRLREMQKSKMPITTAVFPNTDHGMIEFIELPDGKRQYTKFTEGYFRLIADSMKNISAAPYGSAQMVLPSGENQ